ncbi:MAG: hypothetical protein Q9217_003291 [Psora testacea]
MLHGPRDRALLQGPEPPLGYGTWTGDLLEWNFDLRRSTSRWRENGEVAWWKDANAEVGSDTEENDSDSVNRESYVVEQFQYYVGAPGNRPTCNSVPFPNNLSTTISEYTVIWEYEELTETYVDATELCLHRYYGGHNFTSLGGICLHPGGGESRLSFPYALKAPVFTHDWPREMEVHNLAFPWTVQQFCEGQCWCGPDREHLLGSTTTFEVAVQTEAQGTCANEDLQEPACKKQKVNDNSSYSGIGNPLNNTFSPQAATCGGNCTITSSSNKPTCPDSDGSCKCVSVQSTFVPGTDVPSFLTACLSIIVAKALDAQKVSDNIVTGNDKRSLAQQNADFNTRASGAIATTVAASYYTKLASELCDIKVGTRSSLAASLMDPRSPRSE